ncbi:histidine phosphatase family protein [Rhodovulum strictum]|uniref:VPLPA-CTERM sorting domain-containing protein n=1 Tax=Rhodovulum strictum TaxID=58314 RepID=A0A844BGM0_9RHOB|nr:histidine phosphatase family protein [Rhodovulum strictum]MRH20555.1 VPLPA-CTERM sorting domain-containing protein [Rhodovulum strictum]
MNMRVTLAATLVGIVFSTAADAATFLFIRDAQTIANIGQATTPEDLVNPPLTAAGAQQALELADALKDLDLTAIYVSSYQSAVQTIAPTAARFGLTPVAEPAIREWSFGDGTTPLDNAAVFAMFGEWISGNTAARIAGVPDSESLDDLAGRVVPAYRSIFDAHKDEDGVVAIVGHGGSIGWAMPYFAENVPLLFALANNLRNTGIVEVRMDSAGRPVVANWDGIAFEIEEPTPVPLPASGVMLLAALGGIGALRRRVRAA